MASKIKVTESRDLGYWFGIDGVAIRNQVEFDLAVISLASLYGLRVAPEEMLRETLKFVREQEEYEIPEELVDNLIIVAEACIKYLNSVVDRGYKFEFTGEDYSRLELVKVV